jgi:hypothetical protein
MKRRPSVRLYRRIHEIVESARAGAARSVNSAQVVSNWLVGNEIVEGEQRGATRAGYGELLLQGLAEKLQAEFGGGYSYPNLKLIRQFYLSYPALLTGTEIGYAPRSQLGRARKSYAVRSQLPVAVSRAGLDAASWKPGILHPNLSWTHYRILMRVESASARRSTRSKCSATIGRLASWSGRQPACCSSVSREAETRRAS